jgi:hypothetical protein
MGVSLVPFRVDGFVSVRGTRPQNRHMPKKRMHRASMSMAGPCGAWMLIRGMAMLRIAISCAFQAGSVPAG